MPYRQLITIPMTTGASGDTLHVSVALVPRLHEKGTLADYSLDWAHWPTIAAALSFDVLFNRAPAPINPARITVVSPTPRLDVWEALFGRAATSSQPVDQYSFVDRRHTEFRAFPSVPVVDALRDLYAEVSDKFPESPPTSREVLALTASAIFKGSTLLDAEKHLLPTSEPAVVPLDGPGIEFHQMLTILRAHPHLLRLLGLVVDLDIELQPLAPPPRMIRVRTDWAATTGAGARDECPLVMQLDGELWPLPLFPDEHVGQYLKLNNGERYRMTTSDLASASQRLLDFQRTVVARDGAAPIPAPLEAGIAVVHTDLAASMSRRLTHQRNLEDDIDRWLTNRINRPPIIGLEDVAAGYRYDLIDLDDPTWRSPFERRSIAGYTFPRVPALDIEVPDDEGRWTLAVSTEGDELHTPRSTRVTYSQEGKPDIHKDEANDQTTWRLPIEAFRWNGWSAATPHPGSSLSSSGRAVEPAGNKVVTGQAAQLEVDYRPVPGTLPRLRYGNTYQMRARATDLAGNSRTVAEVAPNEAVSPPITFGRTQPVLAPIPIRTVPKAIPGVGDTAATLVIKSELDQPDQDIAITTRHMYPPRLSQARLELHGLPAGGVDPASYDFLAERDALRLDDQVGADPVTGDLVSGSFGADGQHVPADDQPLANYIVDPAATGVTFGGAPGEIDPITTTYRGSWPEQRALQVELHAGDDATEIPPEGAVEPLRFWVARGRVREIELSHTVATDLVEHFDAYRMLAPARQHELRDLIERGRHHIVSARAPLTLVHAVRVPVEPATFSGAVPALSRDAGSRFGAITTGINIDRPSTERVVLIGDWTDPVDVLADTAPSERSYRADTAVPIELGPDDWEHVGLLDGTTLDLVDPRRHTVTLQMTAFSRFSRYFTEQVDGFRIPAASGLAVLPVTEGVVPRSVKIVDADGATLRRDIDFTVDRATGTITRVPTGSLELDTDLTVRYIPLPISRPSIDAPRGTTTQVFPAAIRPTPPVVAGVVPAATRTIDEADDRIIVDHDGRVVRVMLERPWWSSGEEERLAVVLDRNPPAGTVPTRTRWGRDPLVSGGAEIVAPMVGMFPAATETAHVGDADVAAHAVVFDAERGVWIADVPIEAEIGERPFLQLTLARYQPIALDGLALSDEVGTDPVRLGPRRRTAAQRQATPGDVLCSMWHAPIDHTVQVRVQQADTGITDPDLRWADLLDGLDPMIVTLSPSVVRGTTRHRGVITLPTSSTNLRLVLEDLEPVMRTDADTGAAVEDVELVYRETVEIPSDWLL